MPREAKTAATRARLIAATREALIAGGGDFEMSEVARGAGVSNGLPYHHFGNKAGALSAVIDDFYDRQLAIVAADLDPAAPWAERELGRFQRWLAFLYEEPVARVLLGKMGRSVAAAEAESARLDEMLDVARANIQAGQRSGEIPESIDPAIAATVIIGGIRQTATHVFGREKPADATAVANQLWALIAGALRLDELRP